MSLSKVKAKQQLISLVESVKKIVITCHFSPDDDAIGSLLSTYDWLINRYPQKSISMIISNSYIERFSSFLNYQKIKFVPDISTEIEKTDLLIMLDGSQYNRFSRQPETIAHHPCKKVCFDHHSSPIDKFDLVYLDKKATSASEVIMDVLYKNEAINPSVAQAILLGILGDTGTFNFLKPNQLNTFNNVKKLMKISRVEIQEFKSRYSQISQTAFKVIQEYIHNTKFIELKDKPSYQYSFITPEFIKKNQLTDSETSEAGHIYMANYLRTISGHGWGFIATPKRDEISVSFRSLPRSVNVRRLVEVLEIGGGHDRAAGSSFKPDRWGKKLSLNFAIKYLIDWIANHQLELS